MGILDARVGIELQWQIANLGGLDDQFFGEILVSRQANDERVLAGQKKNLFVALELVNEADVLPVHPHARGFFNFCRGSKVQLSHHFVLRVRRSRKKSQQANHQQGNRSDSTEQERTISNVSHETSQNFLRAVLLFGVLSGGILTLRMCRGTYLLYRILSRIFL